MFSAHSPRCISVVDYITKYLRNFLFIFLTINPNPPQTLVDELFHACDQMFDTGLEALASLPVVEGLLPFQAKCRGVDSCSSHQ